jgi:hypothetical protein
MQDEFGLPDRMLGRHPDWFYPALGRVVAVCALLETRAQALAEILAHQAQGTLTKRPIPVLCGTATAAAQSVDSTNDSMNFAPISPRVVEFYKKVGEIMDRRHAVLSDLPALRREADRAPNLRFSAGVLQGVAMPWLKGDREWFDRTERVLSGRQA